ncbi:MAG: BamA/TamA family outer membrane protein, partial [Abditibacteriales bacterium]|nr:BamA/TamA family outer membrane protein [Abditibacteriales bacterium]MDW8366838.1 ShlB/FhaC/HecB family hemolysin secretion/activation protein [Abditibacteriales bacterium]
MKTTSAAVLAVLAVASLTLKKIDAQEVEVIDSGPSPDPQAPQRVRVQSFRFEGNTVIGNEDLARIVAPYQDKELTLTELQQVADKVSEYYRKQGYLLARALLPEQEITGGVVTLQILEGKLGEIVISGNERFSENFIRKAFSRLQREQVIRQDSLERALLILNETPGLRVTSVLQAGKEPGTTDIAVNVEELKDRRDFSLELSNFGTRLASRMRIIPSLSIANLSGRGDAMDFRLVSGSDTDDLFFGRLNYSTPLNHRGTRLNVNFLAGRFEVGEEFAILNIRGRGTAFGVSAIHPIYKSRAKSVTGEIGLDIKNGRQYLLGAKTSDDKIRSVRVGVHFNTTDRKGRTLASLFIHHGLGEALGGMRDDDPFASRIGADNRFTKFTLDAARVQRLGRKSFLIARASGQVTTRSLVVGEQFAIGGADSVRGYPQSEFLGDNGFQLSVEARFTPNPEQMDRFQIALFADHGTTTIKRPVVGQ